MVFRIVIIYLLMCCSVAFGHDAGGQRIKNVATPTDPCDAANKQYVDDTAAAEGHNILSTAHGDAEANSVSRGSLIYGNSDPNWAELELGTSGYILRSDGTDVGWSATTNITALGTIATGAWQATAIDHERGGLEADVSAYTGLVAISGGATSEVDSLSELVAQIADLGDWFDQSVKTTASPTFANITDSGLTSGRVPYASTAGLLVDDANLTFDGTTLTAGGFATAGTLTANVLKATGDGTIWSDGTTGTTPAVGAGIRLMWIPSKRAFRAGEVTGDEWAVADIGTYSFAAGLDTMADGGSSFAACDGARASGDRSAAFNFDTEAGGAGSFAINWDTYAYGRFGLAAGVGTNAESYATAVFGRFNVGGGAATSWQATDPLFEIGIGADDVNRANALTILKNGNATFSGTLAAGATTLDSLVVDSPTLVVNAAGYTDKVGIGTATPRVMLEVAGDIWVIDSGNPRIVIGDSSGAGNWSGIGWNSTYDFMHLGTEAGGVNALVLTESGNIGIGTSSPNSVFHIKANVPGIVGSHHAGQLIIQNPADDVNACAVITGYESDGSGNPDQQLWYLGNSSSGNEDIIFLNRRDAKLALGTSGTSRITILGNGNVGIGVTDPDAKLEVVGTLHVSDAVTFDSTLGAGATTLTGDLTFDGDTARILGVSRRTTSTYEGLGLTINAGGATSGQANKAGGNLTIASGISTGIGSSSILFQTATTGGAGVVDNTPTTKWQIDGAGRLRSAGKGIIIGYDNIPIALGSLEECKIFATGTNDFHLYNYNHGANLYLEAENASGTLVQVYLDSDNSCFVGAGDTVDLGRGGAQPIYWKDGYFSGNLVSGTLDAGTSCEADAYTVGDVSGSSATLTFGGGSGDCNSITVTSGLITGYTTIP